MYEIYVASQFEAAHRLRGDFGPASRLHGHTYRLEALVQGERLAADGTLYDVGLLREAVEGLASGLHMRDLDEVEGLSEGNTTAERVADYCWERLTPDLSGNGLSSLIVRVWESGQVYAAREDEI
ncbi:6-pyruvoyl trahydropterin synthase family protein [Rubrobacter aplysinae]|uniref:6-pyruvoyl trahydropterin synthase family protein n=1 Tax=Rubrobacter aplysinae TaxID=909625 RepID=UPI00064BD737|nr:6-carboxytetrahydropterin synthase [Rubrobacter aplysinae]